MSVIYDARSSGPSPELGLARLVAKQHGVFSRDQALRAGMSRATIDRRARSERWIRLYPGVYRLAGASLTWRADLLAACLAWGPDVLASHPSAGTIWRLPGFERLTIELTVPPTRRRALPHTVHRPMSLPLADRTVVDAIPVTTPARTLLDLAATYPYETVEEALDDALRRKLVTIPQLRWRLRELGSKGRPGAAMLSELIAARATTGALPDTTFETRMLRALRRAGLPRPTLQHKIPGVARIDFAYVKEKIAVETDGYRWHASKQRFEHDRRRNNALTALGWRIVHVTWDELAQRPEKITNTIASLLAASRA